MKLQEIKVHIVSLFKDGSIHFLKMKLHSVENARLVTVMRYVHNKHETGTVIGK